MPLLAAPIMSKLHSFVDQALRKAARGVCLLFFISRESRVSDTVGSESVTPHFKDTLPHTLVPHALLGADQLGMPIPTYLSRASDGKVGWALSHH